MNRVCLIGRITRDPELRYTQSGTAIAKMTLAVNRTFAKEGEQQADFIQITAWAKTAEVMAQYLAKGSQIGVTGRIQTGRYEDKEGRTVYTTEVIVEQMDFLDSRKKEADQEDNDETLASAQAAFPDAKMTDQEIPF